MTVANVERAEERLVMEKCGVVDIKRALAHDRKGALPLLVIINSDVARNSASNWLEGEPADRGFDSSLVEFFDHLVAPVAAEAFLGQIPSAGRKSAEHEQGSQATKCQQKPNPGRSAQATAMEPGSRRFAQ